MTKFAFDEMETRTLSEEGVWLPIKKLNRLDPLVDASGRQLELKVCGPDSTRYRKALRDSIKAQSEAPEGTDSREQSAAFLAACTLDWRMKGEPPETVANTDSEAVASGVHPVRDANGSPVAFSADGVKALLLAYDDIFDQVDAFVSRRTNFSKASSKN